MRRLFIALPLESAVKEDLRPVSENLNRYGQLLKVVDPDNYHITLKFLGNMDEEKAREIIEDFHEYDIDLPGVPVEIKGLGAFPRVKDPRVIWIGIEGDIDALSRLNTGIQDFSFRHGYEREERRFRPHLTIARARKGRKPENRMIQYIEENRETEFGKTSFDRIVLYESVLREDGPVYSEISSKSLK